MKSLISSTRASRTTMLPFLSSPQVSSFNEEESLVDMLQAVHNTVGWAYQSRSAAHQLTKRWLESYIAKTRRSSFLASQPRLINLRRAIDSQEEFPQKGKVGRENGSFVCSIEMRSSSTSVQSSLQSGSLSPRTSRFGVPSRVSLVFH